MKYFLTLLFIFTLLLFFSSPAFAQDTISSGIATYVPIQGNAQPGDIIKLSQNGYEVTKTAYDPSVFGVVVKNPSVSLENTSQPNTFPLISSGKVYVRVSTINGQIKKGDVITSSSIPGVGQKSTNQGYVIGTALQDYAASNQNEIGSILIVLSINFSPGQGNGTPDNLLSSLKQALSAPYLSPLNALRYALAIILLIVSFIVGVSFFGKVSSLGVEAIGRNPLASKTILLGIVFHIFLAGVIIITGLVLAYFILIL